MKAFKIYRFEAKRNPKSLKYVKLGVLQNGCLRFLIFLDFEPKNQDVVFLIDADKIQNFGVNRKSGKYVIKLLLLTYNTDTKFQSIFLV